MFKKKTEEKKKEERQLIARYVTRDEFEHALFILKNAVESGQIASSLGPIPKMITVLPNSAIDARYINSPFGMYNLSSLQVREEDFREKKEVVEEKRQHLVKLLESKREQVDKQIAELEKLSKELGELK